MISALAFLSLASANLLDRLSFLRSGPTLRDQDEHGYPRPWADTVPLTEIHDGMLVVIINSFYDNTRLSAYKDGSCSFFDAYTFTDQLWNLSYTPKWPGVTNEKNDRGRKTYQLQNYRFPDTHWNSWGKCDNGDLAQDNSWDFIVNKNNPTEFQIFNSQYPTYRFG